MSIYVSVCSPSARPVVRPTVRPSVCSYEPTCVRADVHACMYVYLVSCLSVCPVCV